MVDPRDIRSVMCNTLRDTLIEMMDDGIITNSMIDRVLDKFNKRYEQSIGNRLAAACCLPIESHGLHMLCYEYNSKAWRFTIVNEKKKKKLQKDDSAEMDHQLMGYATADKKLYYDYDSCNEDTVSHCSHCSWTGDERYTDDDDNESCDNEDESEVDEYDKRSISDVVNFI